MSSPGMVSDLYYCYWSLHFNFKLNEFYLLIIDETDMAVLEQCVRSVQMEGLIMGASKLVPVGYGIKKLQITTVIEDDKVSVDELVEKIQEFEDYVRVNLATKHYSFS